MVLEKIDQPVSNNFQTKSLSAMLAIAAMSRVEQIEQEPGGWSFHTSNRTGARWVEFSL